MQRIIDISIKDGKLWAEDENYSSDFSIEDGYLFSVIAGIKDGQTSIFYKNYNKAKNIFKGKYYITISEDYDSELHCTNDYRHHTQWNIKEGGYFGDYIRPEYQNTMIIDFDKMIASMRDETGDFEDIIKADFLAAQSDKEHQNSFRQPY